MRLAAEEVEPIMELVQVRLEELYEAQVNIELAEPLFRVLWRYCYPYWGRPSYPEPLTWSAIKGLLRNGPFQVREMSRFEEGKEDPMGTFKVTPIHESLEEDLAKCSVCSKDVPRTLYCINCGAPIEVKKEAEP
jgi:hypothetical protein